ncbi:MAG: hypothetical protein ACHQ16_03355 [Candidatus Lutacidiplasmatales archaeon]
MLIVVAMAVVPVAHPASFVVPAAANCLGHASVGFPARATVSGSWSAGAGSSVEVTVADGSGSPVYDHRGSSGTFAFSSDGGAYAFRVFPSGNSHGCEPVSPTSFSTSWSSPVV